jgi:dUTPase
MGHYRRAPRMVRGSQDVSPESGERNLIPAGIAPQVPTGLEVQARLRRGLAIAHGGAVLNSPGTVGSDDAARS